MKPASQFVIVLITAPNLKTARALAKTALKKRLIACANIVPAIESHYRWKGNIESGMEVLLILKTRKASLAGLETLILAAHPYDTPEILTMSLTAGTERYLRWISQNCG